MAQVVVIGMQGEDKLWVADFENGTLLPMAPAAMGALKKINDRRAAGAASVKGIDFALPLSATASVAAGHLDG